MEGHSGYISRMATGRRLIQRKSYPTPDPTRIGRMRNLHVYLDEHMKAKGMGDVDVAKRIEKRRETVWKWRQKASSLKPAQLALLASALDLEDWRELYQLPPGTGDLPPPESVDAIIADAPEHLRAAIVEFAKKLANRG